MRKTVFILSAAALMFISCNKDNLEEVPLEQQQAILANFLENREKEATPRTTDKQLAEYAGLVKAWEDNTFGTATFDATTFAKNAGNHLNYSGSDLSYITDDSEVYIQSFDLPAQQLSEQQAFGLLQQFESTIAGWMSELTGPTPGQRWVHVGIKSAAADDGADVLVLMTEIGSTATPDPVIIASLQCYDVDDCGGSLTNQSQTVSWNGLGAAGCGGSAPARIQAGLNRVNLSFPFPRDTEAAFVNPNAGTNAGGSPFPDARVAYANADLFPELGTNSQPCEGVRIVHYDPEQDEICMQESQIKDYVCEQRLFSSNTAEDDLNAELGTTDYEFFGAALTAGQISGGANVNYHNAAYFYTR